MGSVRLRLWHNFVDFGMPESDDEDDDRDMTEEERELVIEVFTGLYQIHGRNFLNYFRGTLKEEFAQDIDAHEDDENFRSATTFEFQLERLQQLILKCGTLSYLTRYKVFFFDADINLLIKNNLMEPFGKVEEKEDWFAWSESILDKCRDFNRKYGGIYREALYNFWGPTSAALTKYSMPPGYDDPPMNGRESIFPRVTPRVARSDEEHLENYEDMMKMIEGYKNDKYCGFFYSVLDYFLDHFFRIAPRMTPDPIFLHCEQLERDQKLKKQCGKAEEDAKEVKEISEALSSFKMAPLPNRCNGFSNYSSKEKCLKP